MLEPEAPLPLEAQEPKIETGFAVPPGGLPEATAPTAAEELQRELAAMRPLLASTQPSGGATPTASVPEAPPPEGPR